MTYQDLTDRERGLLQGHFLEGLKQSRPGESCAWWRLYYRSTPLRRQFLALLKPRISSEEFASIPKCFNGESEAIESELLELALRTGFDAEPAGEPGSDGCRWIRILDNPYSK